MPDPAEYYDDRAAEAPGELRPLAIVVVGLLVAVLILVVTMVIAHVQPKGPGGPAGPRASGATPTASTTIFVLCDLTPDGRIENCRQAAPVGVRPS